MSAISKIKSLAAIYLKHENVADFVFGSVDILIESINSARMTVEKLHDFRYAEIPASLIVTAEGGSLADAMIPMGMGLTSGIGTEGGDTLTTEGGNIITNESNSVIVKRIRHVMLPVSDGYLPIEFMTDDEWIARTRRQSGRGAYDPAASLAEYGQAFRNPTAYQQGQNLFLEPASQFTFPLTVKLDVIRFMPDYTQDTDEDFFCRYGAEYLQWAAILELNKKWKDFIPRLEGNVDEDAVESFASAALQALIQWDMDIARSTSTPVTQSQPVSSSRKK